ncbi:DUF2254 domain-containing protein [Microlunatus elymi]|uniref:DUF2254 domain-containing protein n=1 Tax=Microlunatus elymi TaxID=2596828 RepID=A0A516PU57_9ACTN|nr:DUF2254 domain-containing protein [Microlunatus elymi]QDP94735.1 DUF2254 domain-containing protein [Microlunatus elymi]
MSWWTRWRAYEYVRNSLWIVPLLFVAIAVALGFAMPTIDEHTAGRIGISFGSTGASGVLGAIAGGMITFTGFVFSILLLAVQFGSSQFSPRLLRRFLRDPTTKIAFGTFIATFVYALMVLRVVGTGPRHDFVPNNAVSVSLYLLLVSMLTFLRLVSRTTQGLRVATVVSEVGRDGRRIMVRSYPDLITDPAADAVPAQPTAPGTVHTIRHRFAPGIVQSVGIRGLVAFAQQSDTVIELVPRVGDLVATGDPIFRVYGSGGLSAADEKRLQKSIAVGDERTVTQDPPFVFRLLADISAKALSPAVNDPTTSIQALDQINLLLRVIGTRRLDTGVVRDDRGTVRFWRQVPSWEDYLRLALVETHQYGVGSVQVMRRIRALLEDVRDNVPDFRRAAVEAELELVAAAALRSFPEPGDQQAASVADRQGLGATAIARPQVAEQQP